MSDDVPEPVYRPPPDPGMRRYEMRTSGVLVEKFVPREVRAGERFAYTIRITNLTDAPIANLVVVDAGIGRSVIPMLVPRETKVIRAMGMAQQVGQQSSCLTLESRPQLCTKVDVVEPALSIVKRSPPPEEACAQPQFTYEVRNTGTGTAHDVRIMDRLPEGLTTADGRQEVNLAIGDLRERETARRTVPLRAARSGTFESNAYARSQSGEAAARGAITIAQAELSVEISGPGWQYAGEPTRYDITVANLSDVPAHEVVLRFDGADLQPQRIGTIAPRDTKTVSINVPGTSRDVRLVATAQGRCAAPTSDRLVTVARGIGALAVGTIDTKDPVRIGETTTYIVTVKNQGQAPANDLDIAVELPDGMSIVNVRGATRGRLEGGRLILGRLPSLAAQQTVEWHIEMRADTPGTKRFRTEVSSAFMREPVPDEEPTRVIAPR